MEPKIWHKRDFLLRHYWGEQMSLQEIADLFGVTGSHIHYHMKKHDIPRRSCTKPTQRTKQKQSKSKKNLYQSGALVPWNLGISRSTETKQKIAETRKKRIEAGLIKPWNKGKRTGPLSEETRRKISAGQRGRKQTAEHIRKRVASYKKYCEEHPDFFSGKNNPFYGKTHSKESREKMSLSRLGEKNHRWLGGSSYKDYPLEFNEILKRQIRERDSYTCSVCGSYGNVVHHINYDKKDNHPTNLVTVCREDHIRTNSNRDHWIEYFYKLCKSIG